MSAIALAGAAGSGAWVFDRSRYVETTDARIMADMILVSAETTARITDTPAVRGARVAPDDILMRLDDGDARHELARLKAEQAALHAAMHREQIRRTVAADAGAGRIDARESGLHASQAELRSAQALLQTAKAEHDRTTKLHVAGIVARPALERAADRLESARRELGVADAASRQRSSEVAIAVAEGAEAQLIAAEIDVLQRRAEAMQQSIALQQRIVDRHAVRAPAAGVIDDVFVEAGERAEAGARLLLMHDPRSIWIEARVKETELPRIAVGAKVRVVFDAMPGRMFAAQVHAVRDVAVSQLALVPPPNPSGVFTKITQRVPVRIVITESDLPADLVLRPGGMATVRVRARAP